MSQEVIIIGAGLAGLSAGIHALASGYRVHIVDLHSITGGVCTAWKREDFLIDGCIHWLTGSRSGPLRDLYEEVGALQGNNLLFYRDFARFVDEETSQQATLGVDLDAWALQLLEISSADRDAVEDLMKHVSTMRKLPNGPPRERQSLRQGLEMMRGAGMGFLELFLQREPVRDYTTRFRSPILKDFLNEMFLPDMPAAILFYFLGQLADGQFSVPEGGSLRFVQAMERTFLAQGGRITCNAMVERILVEQDRAVGVRLTTGEELRAAHVISAADGYSTIFRMLEGAYADDALRERYTTGRMFDPILMVTAGFGVPMPQGPALHQFRLSTPFFVDGRSHPFMNVRTFKDDPTLVPAGHGMLQVMLPTDFDRWMDLHHTPSRYSTQKQRVGRAVVERAAGLLGVPMESLKMMDVATPYTYYRFTRNHRGAFEGWRPSTRMVLGGYDNVLPGLGNFYMAGQWVVPGGGVPTAIQSGKVAVQRLCRENHGTYAAPVPPRAPPG
jgi:phytoene desaturase